MRPCGSHIHQCVSSLYSSLWWWLRIIEKFQLKAALEPALAIIDGIRGRVNAGDSEVELMVAELSPALMVRILAKLYTKILRKHRQPV